MTADEFRTRASPPSDMETVPGLDVGSGLLGPLCKTHVGYIKNKRCIIGPTTIQGTPGTIGVGNSHL